MNTLGQSLKELRAKRAHLEQELARVAEAVVALQRVMGHGAPQRNTKRGRPRGTRLSPKARARISAAQKTRWAKVKSSRRAS